MRSVGRVLEPRVGRLGQIVGQVERRAGSEVEGRRHDELARLPAAPRGAPSRSGSWSPWPGWRSCTRRSARGRRAACGGSRRRRPGSRRATRCASARRSSGRRPRPRRRRSTRMPARMPVRSSRSSLARRAMSSEGLLGAARSRDRLERLEPHVERVVGVAHGRRHVRVARACGARRRRRRGVEQKAREEGLATPRARSRASTGPARSSAPRARWPRRGPAPRRGRTASTRALETRTPKKSVATSSTWWASSKTTAS